MNKFLFFTTIFLLTLFSFASRSFAASISLSAPETVGVGNTFEVLINVDSGGALINSVDLVLDYDENLLSFAGYKNENAVVNFWIDSPHEKDGYVYMGGIIPGGVSGLYDSSQAGVSSIPITRLLFITRKEGGTNLSFIRTTILKNDGRGTELVHEQKGADLKILKNNQQYSPEDGSNIFDKNPPEPFNISFIESSLFSRTPFMIIFKANDNGSGIKKYQIKRGDSKWQDANSPQPISRGIFSQSLTIRAFDFSNNFRDSNIRLPGLLSPKFLIILFVLLISGIFASKLLKYKV